MVDAWTPAVEAAVAAADAGATPAAVLEAAAQAAAAGAEATVELIATKGRASYLGERSQHHMDPGARSTELILRAAAQAAGVSERAAGAGRVALVLVSHSRALAEGAVELAGQMAPGVLLIAAGGMDDGGLGTSFDAIEAALATATADGGSAVVLTDLGSAVLTAESVLELADPDVASRASGSPTPRSSRVRSRRR